MPKVLTRKAAYQPQVVFRQTTGVLGRDGTAYVPRTVWATNTAGLKRATAYTPLDVLMALADPSTSAVEVVDEANTSVTMTVRPVDPSTIEARLPRFVR